MAAGTSVGVGSGMVGVEVSVCTAVAVGAGMWVGAAAGAQADRKTITSERKVNLRIIVSVLLWRLFRLTFIFVLLPHYV
jgi:hypothetical protein